ncbi:MAG TPA: hypothetical protein VEW71_04150 [Allosphingosinicella sp.]|nr:hypothetical protein [Allosphingosinicella sp.]
MERGWLEAWASNAEPRLRAPAIIGLGVLVGFVPPWSEEEAASAEALLAGGVRAIGQAIADEWNKRSSESPRSAGRLYWGGYSPSRWETFARILPAALVGEAWLSIPAWEAIKLTAPLGYCLPEDRQPEVPIWLNEQLRHSGRGNTSLYFDLWTSYPAHRSWHWPLRLGFLADALSRRMRAAFLEQESSWLHELTVAVEVERNGFGCDLLVSPLGQKATAQALARARARAAAVVLLGTAADRRQIVDAAPGVFWQDAEKREGGRTPLFNESGASAIGYLSESLGDLPGHRNVEEWAPFIKRVVRCISHDLPLDAALYEAARDAGLPVPVVIASGSFIEASRISRLGGAWADRLRGRDEEAANELADSATGDFLSELGEASDILSLARRADARRPQLRHLQARIVDTSSDRMFSGDLAAAPRLEPDKWNLLTVWIAPLSGGAESPLAPFPEDSLAWDGQDQELEVAIAAPGCRVRTAPLGLLVDQAGRFLWQDDRFRPGPLQILEGFPDRMEDMPIEESADDAAAMQSIWLSEAGWSQCALFLVRPIDVALCKARIMVLHGNRVLQTAILTAPVGKGTAPEEGEGLELKPEGVIRSTTQDLGDRRLFDLAILTNDSLTGKPQITAIGDQRVVLRDMDEVKEIAERIEAILKPAVRQPEAYEDRDSTAARDILIELATEGVVIRRMFHDARLGAILAKSPARIQVVAAKPDEVLPFEYIYDGLAPSREAMLCPERERALSQGSCGQCPNRESGDHVCPMRFWGLSKIIERQLFDPETAPDHAHVTAQAPSPDLAAIKRPQQRLFACSDRARAFENGQAALDALKQRIAGAPPLGFNEADCWKVWCSHVDQYEPSLLVILPHVEKTGSLVEMEIGAADRLNNAQIQEPMVGKARPVMVMLLGCGTGGQDVRYISCVAGFRSAKASVVIGTLMPILGRHAVRVAGLLITELDSYWDGRGPPATVGDAMTEMRRRLMADGVLTGMMVVAFGDADWLLGAEC